MKKLKILIPSLIATVSMPLVSLAGCKTSDSNNKQWIVQFNTNGGSFIKSICVDDGQTIKEPAEPSRKGFTFNGWFKDEDLQEPYYFTEPVTADTTVYVAWKSNQVTSHLYFTTDGEGTLSDYSIEVPTGTKWIDLYTAGMLPTPTPAEEFNGWYHNEKKLEPSDRSEINEDWYICARFAKPQIKNLAYIIDCPEEISLTNTEVIKGKKFETRIVTTGEYIDVSWIKVVINGGTKIEPAIEIIDAKTIKLTVDNPLGNIAIIMDNTPLSSDYHSHLCNDESDGFELVNNEVYIGNPLIATIESSQPVDETGAVAKVVINNQELDPKNYSYQVIDKTIIYIAITDTSLITDDIFIWMDLPTINWDSYEGPYPYEVTPLPEDTPAAEAEGKFYDWINSNKKNLIHDFVWSEMQMAPFPVQIDWMWVHAGDIDISVDEDNIIQINKLTLEMAMIYREEGEETSGWFNYAKCEASNVKSILMVEEGEEINGYAISSILDAMAYYECIDFLKTDQWEITLTTVDSNEIITTTYNTEYAQSLTSDDEEWFNIFNVYKNASLPHICYYLQNITPPESK